MSIFRPTRWRLIPTPLYGTVPANETQKLTANWGVWSCYWVPVWVWCDHGETADIGWMKATGNMSTPAILPPSARYVPDAGRYCADGLRKIHEERVRRQTGCDSHTLHRRAHQPHHPSADGPFPYSPNSSTRLTCAFCNGCPAAGAPNSPSSPMSSRLTAGSAFYPHLVPGCDKLHRLHPGLGYWTPDGMLSINLNDYVSIDGSLYDDWYTNRE